MDHVRWSTQLRQSLNQLMRRQPRHISTSNVWAILRQQSVTLPCRSHHRVLLAARLSAASQQSVLHGDKKTRGAAPHAVRVAVDLQRGHFLIGKTWKVSCCHMIYNWCHILIGQWEEMMICLLKNLRVLLVATQSPSAESVILLHYPPKVWY